MESEYLPYPSAPSTCGALEFPPIDLEKSEIRVLRILPDGDEDGGLIRCTLSTVLVAERHFALSYVWGTDQPASIVEVNGHDFLVRKNLFDFLNHARPKLANQNIWIDAICLDQSNISERNHQVRRMRDIYESAVCVISWLGCGYSTLRAFFRSHGNANFSLEKLFQQPPVSTGLSKRYLYDVPNDLLSHSSSVFYETLRKHEYWSRLWIIPELLVARKVALLYEHYLMSWEDLWPPYATWKKLKGDPWLNNTERRRHEKSALDHLIYDAERRLTHGLRSIESMLRQYGANKCSDKRDRFFALLGLADDFDASTIDYSLGSLQLFKQSVEDKLSRSDHFEPFAEKMAEVLELNATLDLPADVPTMTIAVRALSTPTVPPRVTWADSGDRDDFTPTELQLVHDNTLALLCIDTEHLRSKAFGRGWNITYMNTSLFSVDISS